MEDLPGRDYVRYPANIAGSGLTGTTSAAGLHGDIVETLKASEHHDIVDTLRRVAVFRVVHSSSTPGSGLEALAHRVELDPTGCLIRLHIGGVETCSGKIDLLHSPIDRGEPPSLFRDYAIELARSWTRRGRSAPASHRVFSKTGDVGRWIVRSSHKSRKLFGVSDADDNVKRNVKDAAHPADPILDRIASMRERLATRHGRFSDSAAIIRELRDSES